MTCNLQIEVAQLLVAADLWVNAKLGGVHGSPLKRGSYVLTVACRTPDLISRLTDPEQKRIGPLLSPEVTRHTCSHLSRSGRASQRTVCDGELILARGNNASLNSFTQAHRRTVTSYIVLI